MPRIRTPWDRTPEVDQARPEPYSRSKNMDSPAALPEAAWEDISLDDVHPDEVTTPGAEGPEFLWAKVAAEEDLSGIRVLEVRSSVPTPEPVVQLRAVGQVVEEVLRRQGRRDARLHQPVDRNLVTTGEFACAVNIAESTVFELLKRGLPSTKTKGLGRRILKEQAVAWLVAGGPERSRVAKRVVMLKGNGRG